MEIEALIEAFKGLDLAKYPKEEIEFFHKQAGKIAHVLVTLHKDKPLIRARPNYDGERFEKKTDYSYKPQNLNTSYQRASTPNKTMFYACFVPETILPGELDNMRVIGVVEAVPMLRDKTKSGYQKISFGKWYVNEDINLIAIVQKDRYAEKSNFTSELSKAYLEFVKKTPPEILERSLAYTTFLADEFSKDQIRGDFDYMISAIFAELTTKFGVDGVLYPSVRAEGRGFNIAITPEATKKIGLYAAGECSLYKLRDKIVIGNDAIIELTGKEDEFKLIDIERYEKECLSQLGVDSIDALS